MTKSYLSVKIFNKNEKEVINIFYCQIYNQSHSESPCSVNCEYYLGIDGVTPYCVKFIKSTKNNFKNAEFYKNGNEKIKLCDLPEKIRKQFSDEYRYDFTD
jgi:hypothetical protein